MLRNRRVNLPRNGWTSLVRNQWVSLRRNSSQHAVGRMDTFNLKKGFENKTLEIMTWAGLRGGISIALALSIPADAYKNTLVTITFVIVMFSILVQDFTTGKLIRYLKPD